MILGSDHERQIGARYRGIWIDGVLHPEQPFVVLREATLEEWLEEQAFLGKPILRSADRLAGARFYEVAMG